MCLITTRCAQLADGSHDGWDHGLLFRAIGVPVVPAHLAREVYMPMEEHLSVVQPRHGSGMHLAREVRS